MNKNPWEMLVAQANQSGFVPENIVIDDGTNAPMIPKSMSVQVKRPLAYARPATAEESVGDLFQQYGDASQRALAEQNRGVDKLEGQLGEIKQTVMPDSFGGKLSQVNVAPLMAYVDSINNTNTLQGYKQPESMSERQKMILGLEDAIQKRRGEVARSEADALKEKIGLYLKDKDDPLKMFNTLATIQYKKDMGDLARSRLGEQEQNHFAKSDDAKTLKSGMKFKSDLENYERLVRKYGTEVAGERRQELDTAFSELGLSYKEAKNLGALTGPDWSIVQSSIAPSTGLKGVYNKFKGGGSEGALKGLSQVKKNTERDMNIHTGSAKTFYDPKLVDQFKNNITPPKQAPAGDTDDAAYQRFLELKKKHGR